MKCPEFQAERVGNSLYLNQTGNRTVPIKVSRAMRKSMKRLPGDINARWVYLNGSPALLGKGKAEAVILSGKYRLLKAKQAKDLAYWKRKLLSVLGEGMTKSLGDILYPEGVPEECEGLLLKARGFPTGTIRTWGGKEYKKMASGKWVRTYKEEQSRGAKQAIRNVKKKIENAKSMAELLEIVKENQSRFQDKDGRMLPIVKEFMAAARWTGAGEKKKEAKAPIAKEDRWGITEAYKDKSISEVAHIVAADIKGYLDLEKRLDKEREEYQNAVDLDEDEAADKHSDAIDEIEKKMKAHVSMSAMGFGVSKDEYVGLINSYTESKNSERVIADELSNIKAAREGSINKPGGSKDAASIPEEDYEKKAEETEKKNDVPMGKKPATGEKAQKVIQDATPKTRDKSVLELGGTEKKARNQNEVMDNQEVSREFKPKDIEIEIDLDVRASTVAGTSEEIPKSGRKIKCVDYTDIDSREVMLVSYKSIQKELSGTEKGTIPLSKPEWIPPITFEAFQANQHTLVFTERDGKYYVPLSQQYYPHGARRYDRRSGEQIVADNYDKQQYAVMTLAEVAATQDYYRKVAKAHHDAEQQARQKVYESRGYRVGKKRLKVLAKNKMLYDHMYMVGEFNSAKSRNMAWVKYNENQAAISQKTMDMDMMREEVDNSYSKGTETSYGDKNTSDALFGESGIKVKRQNGDDVTPEDVQYIKDAMTSVESVFGNRKSMNEKFGLKVSYAKGTHMHARKAVGLFVPMQHAIGVSDGKGLQRKNPFTGEKEELNYGDEKFGGFVLAHEYAHMMDYYVGRQKKQWYASDEQGSTAARIAATFRKNMNQASKSNYVNRTCECFARALEQYHAIESSGEDAQAFYEPYVASDQYVNADVYRNQIKPLVEQFLQENDELLKSISENMEVIS